MAVNPFVVTSDIVEVVHFCNLADQISMNRTHYLCSSHAASGATVGAILLDITLAMMPLYQACMSAQANYLGASGRIISPAGHKSPLYWFKRKGAGAVAGAALPRQTCGMFTKVTGNPGKAGRGRVYVPFPAAADQQPALDAPDAGYMVNLGSLAAGLFAQRVVGVGNVSTMDPALVHVGPPVTYLLWSNATARPRWATHRTRGDYGRPNAIPDALV